MVSAPISFLNGHKSELCLRILGQAQVTEENVRYSTKQTISLYHVPTGQGMQQASVQREKKNYNRSFPLHPKSPTTLTYPTFTFCVQDMGGKPAGGL